MAYTKLDRVRPSPAGVWDSTRSYTALELVNSPDGWKAYLARKAVPAGTALTDVTYWTEVLDVSDVIAAAKSATADANAAAAFAEPIRTKADGIKCTIEGASVTATDASDDYLRGLRVFGKTTQDGTPSPDNPVELVNVGSGGSVTVTIEGGESSQSLILSTPNGLPGIPVSRGGNYTDADGQQWVCDEVDLERGMFVQRILRDIEIDSLLYSVNRSDATMNYISVFGGRTVNGNSTTADTPFLSASIPCFDWDEIQTQHEIDTEAVGWYATASFGVMIRRDALGLTTETDTETIVAAVKGWAMEHAVKINLILATPVETPLSATEIAAYRALHSNYPNTGVYNDAGAHMAVSYNADTKTYIDNKFAALSAAIV